MCGLVFLENSIVVSGLDRIFLVFYLFNLGGRGPMGILLHGFA